jgi:NADH-quinone oxidoreductase subunit N
MNFEPFNLLTFQLLSPEIWMLSMSCLLLIVSLFSKKWIYPLAQVALLGATLLTLGNFHQSKSLFDGMYLQDSLASLLKLFVYGSTALVFLYTHAFVPTQPKQKSGNILSEYYVLGLFSVLGMMVLISAGHFITFFLGLEILSLPLYALVALERNSPIAAEAAMKYFVTGALASALLLYGFSMFYGATQSLSFLSIAQKISQAQSNAHLMLMVGLVFSLAGILFKLGATPFHMWVPDVYQGSTTPVTLFVASAPKIAALGILLRFIATALPSLHIEFQPLLIGVSVASIALGNLVAIVQTNLKRMLGYSSIAHVGYMLLGIIAADADGYAASVFYIFMYTLMIAGALGTLALMNREGAGVENIRDLQGLNTRSPWLAFVMLLVMFSMAGIPPLVGFFAKLGVLEALVRTHFVWLATLALIFSIIGAYYYIAVVKVMYFEEPTTNAPIPMAFNAQVAIVVNGLAILALGVFPSMLIGICRQVIVGI